MIRNLSLESISVEPEHKDNQMEQPSDFLRAFKMSDGRSLTEEEQNAILKRLKSLAKGKQVFRGTWYYETILMNLHLLYKQRDNRVADTDLSEEEKKKHPLLLPSRSIIDQFLTHFDVLPVSKRCCPVCNSLVTVLSEQISYTDNHGHWTACVSSNWLSRSSALRRSDRAIEVL